MPPEIPENLRDLELEPQINVPSRIIKRQPNSQVINRVLGEMVLVDGPVLEIGSGTGELYRLLNDQYRTEYTGVDYDPRYIAFNRFDNPGVNLVEADISKLPFDDSSQPTVLALNVLDTATDFWATVGEIERVLQPGGSFIHFHDRRPNLGFLMGHFAETVIPFPNINEDGFFDRFRFVSTDTYVAKGGTEVNALNIWLSYVVNNPSAIELITFVEPDSIRRIARLVENKFGKVPAGDPSITPTFKDLFTYIVSQALALHGMEVKTAGDQSAEALVASETVAPLIKHSGLKPPYKTGNTFVIDANAHYHYESPRRDDIPPNQTLVRTMLNVIASSKPA